MITEAVKAESWFPELGRRGPNFVAMIDHVTSKLGRHPVIVETGTAWSKGEWRGHGQSTLIWDWLAKRYPVDVYSIDIREEACQTAAEQTEKVKYLAGVDAAAALHALPATTKHAITLLYLDSHDWTLEGNLDAAMQAHFELAAVWAALPSGCMVCCDDRHGEFKGKHWVVGIFMERLGIAPVFKNCQIAWVKP